MGSHTYWQVLTLPRGLGPVVVPPEHEDENGHMNIRHYFDIASRAIADRYEAFGITDAYRASGFGFFTVENTATYHAECRVGDEIAVHVRTQRRSEKAVHSTGYVVNDSTRSLACTFTSVAVHVDLSRRRAAPMGSDLKARVDEFAAEIDPAGQI